MVLVKTVIVVNALGLFSVVASHGYVPRFEADGITYNTIEPNRPQEPNQIAWAATTNPDWGFVTTTDYSSPDIICHRGAVAGTASAPVTAGSQVTLHWSMWPEAHHGPVFNYMANCRGPCESADKSKLEWFKIEQVGMLEDAVAGPPYGVPGRWATALLIEQGLRWTTTIPASIVPGNYILRHELLSFHQNGHIGGTQNYPYCFNLVVSGSGTEDPSGVIGTELYKASDPGITLNSYEPIGQYVFPGPALFNDPSISRRDASSGSSSSSTASDSVSSTASTTSSSVSSSATTTSSAASSSTSTASSPFSSATSTASSSISSTTSTLTSTASSTPSPSSSSSSWPSSSVQDARAMRCRRCNSLPESIRARCSARCAGY